MPTGRGRQPVPRSSQTNLVGAATSPTAKGEQALAWLLRFQGSILLLALLAVVMPTSWMEAINDAIGLEPLPRTPLVEYLTRSLSGLYAYVGMICLYLANDVRRFAGLIRYMSSLGMVFATGLLLLDGLVGLPAPWVSIEGPVVFLLCLSLWLLARRIRTSTGVPIQLVACSEEEPATFTREPESCVERYDSDPACPAR